MPTFVPVSDEILDDRNGRSTQKKSIGNKYKTFKVLCFLKMHPIFVGSVHNFGRSDDDMI